MNLAFIGGGNMAYALIAGLKSQQYPMSEVIVVEPNEDKREQLKRTFGIQVTDRLSDCHGCNTIVLAVKPQQLKSLAQALAPWLKDQLIISIAAGVRLKDLSRWLNNYQLIVRAMPNTPAQIQAGITGLYALPNVNQYQRTVADQVLRAAGDTVWLDSEAKLDAVTAISGSGPAYVFYMIEGLIEAALALGLSAQEAQQLAISTFKGSGLLAASSNIPIETLRAQVTSKGGTTEQGLISLENAKIKQALINAAQCAYARAISLGDELGQD